LGEEEGDRVIAPLIQEALPGEGVDAIAVGLLERPHRHELDHVDAERFEVGNLLDKPGESASPGNARGRMLGEAMHVQFIDDRLVRMETVWLIVAPVECVVDDQAASRTAAAATENSPRVTLCQLLDVRVQKLLTGIEAMHLRLRIRNPFHAVSLMDAGSSPFRHLYSGCPGHLLPGWRKVLVSSRVTANLCLGPRTVG
jgi:hypothetical protein